MVRDLDEMFAQRTTTFPTGTGDWSWSVAFPPIDSRTVTADAPASSETAAGTGHESIVTEIAGCATTFVGNLGEITRA